MAARAATVGSTGPDRRTIRRCQSRQRNQGTPAGRARREGPSGVTTTGRMNRRIAGPHSCWLATLNNRRPHAKKRYMR